MTSLLALLILARTLEFDRVEVDWIAATGTVRDLDQVLPRREAGLIRLLGNPDYLVRELAAQELRAMGKDASAALAWGMHSRDPEVRQRSAALRDEIARCPRCARREEIEWGCRSCGGSGDIRYEINSVYKAHDFVGFAYDPRDLFGRTGKDDMWP